MNVLAIETATKACSACLLKDGEVFSRFELAPQKHANLILGMVEAIMVEAQIQGTDIDLIALSEGPGAFTGVRVATGVVQGLAFGWQVPVLGVSTLEALIWQAYESTGQTHWVACLDARMKEVYCQTGRVEKGKLVSQKPVLVSLEKAEPILRDQSATGDIHQEYPGLVKMAYSWQENLPTAEAIAKIAEQRADKAVLVTNKVPVPVYLRNNVAEKKKEA